MKTRDPIPEGQFNPFITDEAKRISDIVNAYLVFTPHDELMTKWIAIKLADGSTDGTLYDSRRDAIRHQLSPEYCAYLSFRNIPNGITPSESGRYLAWARGVAKAGGIMPDPDEQFGGPEAFMGVNQYDNLRKLGLVVPGDS